MDANLLLALAAAVLLLGVAIDHLRLRRALARRPAPPHTHGRPPSITIVRPVRGLDVGAEQNLAALLDLQYQGDVDILIVFDDRDDPAWTETERVVAAHPSRWPVRLLVAGPPPRGRTGKLNAMIRGVEAARGELIAFSDSDTRPAPDLLNALVDELEAQANAADAFAPALVAEAPRTAGDVAYAILMNAWYGCAAAHAAQRTGALPFIMGQLMLWRRDPLERIGGLACADGQLVDDMFLGRRTARFGFTNVMTPRPLDIFTGGMTLGQFLHLFRRWLMFSRNGLPWRFTWEMWMRGAGIWIALALFVLAGARGAAAGALNAVAVLASAAASQIVLHRRFGGAPIPARWCWVPLLLPLVGPFVLLSALAMHKVDWRGRDYAIATDAHLDGNAADHRPASV